MYDHLYTKVGLRYAQQLKPGVTLGLPLLTLVTTSSALVLFAAVVRKDGGGVYSTVDVAVSYILLAGAVALELLSVLTFTLSFRSYCFLREKLGASSGFTKAVFWLVRSVRPYHKPLWSNKWAQYNLLAGCVKEKQAGVFNRAMRYIGLAGDTEIHHISDDTKELICNELDDERRLQQFSHLRGQGILELRGSEGHVAHRKARDEVKKILAKHNEKIALTLSDAGAVRKMLEAGVPMIADPAEDGTAPEGVDVVFARDSYETIRPVLPRAWRLAQAPLHGRRDTETEPVAAAVIIRGSSLRLSGSRCSSISPQGARPASMPRISAPAGSSSPMLGSSSLTVGSAGTLSLAVLDSHMRRDAWPSRVLALSLHCK
ncbi:hypothetical protein U9M48_000853, partial [Paspalum notatum var. saurae]